MCDFFNASFINITFRTKNPKLIDIQWIGTDICFVKSESSRTKPTTFSTITFDRPI